ncbi:cation/h(+) antiporter 14 [Quercus suber]|uniref:Cation/h(+) antiporter 14 n=1 Tax=Quercus suber TaxID=58331 RepID=A0AAW0L5Y3_QUESU
MQEIGRFASSISLASDAGSWLLSFIVRNVGTALKYSPTEPLSFIATVVGYYCILIFLMRPLVIWIHNFAPKNRANEENHFIAILCIVLVNGFLAEYIGEHARIGAFVLGLSLPNGPTLGTTIIKKLEAICTGLLLPIYCATSGYRTQLSSIANMSAAKTELIIFAGYFGKFIGTILPSIYFKIPFKESLTLALIMCCKGVMEITTLRLATIFIRHLYDPSTRYMANTRRTITNSAQNSGLRMLVCIHSEENVSSFTNLIEVSNPTKENPIFVCVLQLVEITGQAASVLVKLDKQNNLLASNLDYSEQISNAFDHYENYSEGSVKIQNFKAIAPCASMHDDICTLAVDKKTSIIIVPFHKTWAIDGTTEENIPFLRTINKNVLNKAPCSIGVLVDRGEIGGNSSILTGNSSYLIAMIFIGGADDREALAYSIRMAGHPNVNLTVVQLIASGYNASNYQNNLDKEAMDELWASINGNQKIKHEEETVKDGADTTHVIQKMANSFDLVIVGRYHEPHSPVTLGLTEWSECPELGVLGDMLASSSFRFSVLVAGIILGPTLLGQSKVVAAKLFPPGARLVFLTFAEFGFMFHLFLLGLQIDISLVKSIGRKAVVIALTGTIIPLLFGVAAYKIVEHAIPSEHGVVLIVLISINALTPFIDITNLLNEMNILNSEIGRFASSISLASDAGSWLLSFIVRNVGTALKYSPTEPLSFIATVVGYYCILIFLMRPLVIWIHNFAPKNRANEENHFIAILCIVLVNGFLAEYIGEHARIGAFVLGLSLPNGPTLGTTIIKKLEAICTGLLLPIYCATSGYRTQLSSIANMSAAKTELIIFAGYFGKFIGTILPSIYFKIPFKESLTLALIMCCKGVMEITTLRLATIFIRHLYDPSTRYMANTRRTITNSAQNSGLRMLVCIHSEENVSSFTNLIEVSNPTKENPIFVCVLQLVEITGQAASVLVKLDKQNNLLASNLDYSEQISNAFDHYENYSEGSVKIQNFKAIAPCASMHDDICTLAVDKKTSIIIVPFHKTWAIDGTTEENIPFLRTINKNVLNKAPCSIGVLVDRGEIGGNSSILTGNSSYLIAMIFIGGADDREALAYSIRMAGHPNVNLTVVQLIASGYNASNYQNNLDKEAMDELWASINGNQKIKHEEETVKDGADTTHVIQKMANSFDLVIVGRYHEPHSPVTLGLTEWSECPELGVLGDMLASSSFRFSVLVVQHNSPE